MRQNLNPPESLDAKGRDAWQRIVDSRPEGWLTDERSALLERYCGHVDESKRLNTELQTFGGVPEDEATLNRYCQLRELFARETNALIRLGCALGISHSRMFTRYLTRNRRS